MATIDKRRPDGIPTDWSWEIADRIAFASHEISGGESGEMVYIIRAGTLHTDIHIDRLALSLENAPGGGKTVSVTVSNGIDTMTVNVSGSDVAGYTTTNNFDLDASVQDLTVTLDSDAGAASGTATIFLLYHDITIT